jgi:hypothetical protein
MPKQKREPARSMCYEPRYPEYVAPEHPTMATLNTYDCVHGPTLGKSTFTLPVREGAMDAYQIKSRGVRC